MIDNKKLNVNKKFKKIIIGFKNEKILGYIIDLYRKSKSDFDSFILDNDIDFIFKDFSEFYDNYKELYRMIDKKLGFGKKMGNDIYIHKNYENDLPRKIINSKRKIPKDFEYTIIKWNIKNNSVSFIKSENFDIDNEPIVDDSYRVIDGIIVKYRPKSKRDQIYHHKWMFVKPSYKGFDYNKSVLRSLKWYKKYDYNSRMVGYKDYWDSLKINESYTEEEIKIANKTSRTSINKVAVGNNAVVPSFVEKIASKNDLILDYGAGKYPLYTIRLKEKGYNVKSYDFGINFTKLHDNDALKYKYDLIFASNVLNVQSTLKMLNSTINEIISLMKNDSIFIANYPIKPRKMNINIKEMKNILNNYFTIDNLGKNTMLMKKKKLNENLIFDTNENNFFGKNNKKIHNYETFTIVIRNYIW